MVEVQEIDIENIFIQMLENTRLHLSDIKPSEWYESKMVMPRGSAFPGPFSFNLTPFWREPLDCADKNHPAKEISIMKGAQLGGTAAVLNPLVGYTIAQNPGNMMFLTGHSDLSEAAFVKIDQMIDNCGIRYLIRPNVQRAKNSRSGDTNKLKEFPGGDLKGGSVTNHNLLRQHDVMIMVVDDFDAAAMSSKHAGSTRELVQKRTSAFAHKKKIFYVSSPQLSGSSNIESVFKMGDQRFFNVPCPKCGAFIVLRWKIEVNDKDLAGITWKVDDKGHLDVNSVGYICQECGDFFRDSHKYEMNLAGLWKPTMIPIEPNHYSYQISSLYAPPGMDDWAYYVQQYINANPTEGRPSTQKNQTFMNVVLGEPYEQHGESPQASSLMKNIRNYEPGIIPEKESVNDGNGRIVMLTCACDLNGVVDDARLDWEIVAWSESGSSYSILHGSIGTFVPRENSLKVKQDRERWTYEQHKPKSVWPVLDEIIARHYMTDSANPIIGEPNRVGRQMKIVLTGVDTGHYTEFAYNFIDYSPSFVIGLKGDKESKFRKYDADTASFKASKERGKLYLVDVNFMKDQITELMKLDWQGGRDSEQPSGFMNYPSPSGGMYQFVNYFSHYESEERIIENKDGQPIAARWVKKSNNPQNHFWDVRLYNMALKDILTDQVTREAKIKRGTWTDFCEIMFPNMK